MPGPVPSQLDANQVLQHAFDDATGKLRVDATVTASVGNVTIQDDDGNELSVNPDGSIDVNLVGDTSIEISAADGDNIAISDGTRTLDINPDGSLNAQISATDLDIRDLSFATDKVDVSGSDVNILSIPLATGAATEAKQDAGNLSLSDINSKLNTLGQKTMTGSVPVVLASDQSGLNVNIEAFTGVAPSNVQLVGSIDGTKTGTKYGFVNNLRLQILDSHDRNAEFTYADFGTKNQRISQIDYFSPTFPGITIRRIFNYTLVGNNYRRDDEIWTVV